MIKRNIYVVAKLFRQVGCVAYRCQTVNEARCLPGTLEATRNPGVQIIVLDDPELYGEYAPYIFTEDIKEFISYVNGLEEPAS